MLVTVFIPSWRFARPDKASAKGNWIVENLHPPHAFSLLKKVNNPNRYPSLTVIFHYFEMLPGFILKRIGAQLDSESWLVLQNVYNCGINFLQTDSLSPFPVRLST